ncbi:MAG: AbrB/MazE/SpoVT family DNA-binding domain-containing protein [Alphaproteobacteria bacterium]
MQRATSTLTSKGQTTIPKPVRDALGVRPGDELLFTMADDGTVRLSARTVSADQLFGMLHRPGQRALSIAEINDAIAEGAIASAGFTTKRRRAGRR